MFLAFFQRVVLEEPLSFWCVCILAVGMVWGGLPVGWIGGDAGMRQMERRFSWEEGSKIDSRMI